MSNREFGWEDVADGLEIGNGAWRWGHTATFVVEDEGRLWRSPVMRFHCEEGYDGPERVECEEVEAVQVTRTEYRVKTDA